MSSCRHTKRASQEDEKICELIERLDLNIMALFASGTRVTKRDTLELFSYFPDQIRREKEKGSVGMLRHHEW